MSLFDTYFRAPVRAQRAYVFHKVFLGMVALDTWLLMIGHAGRYGVDGFNVAQFAWLDRLLPVPSVQLYVAVLLSTGLLALTIALAGAHPLASFGLFLLYTFSWSMSMLDSYQHHYFVSTVLLCLVFFPRVDSAQLAPVAAPTASSKKAKRARATGTRSARPSGFDHGERMYVAFAVLCLASYALIDAGAHPWLLFSVCFGALALATLARARRAASGPPRLATGFGYNLLAASVGIVYTFTSIAKMDAQWVEGYTIRRISSAGRVFAPLSAAAQQLGMSEPRFWQVLSTSVIPLELAIAVGYWFAVRQDESASAWPRRVAACAFVLALTLHVGAEAMGLEIGWFSYYMLLLACTFLLPGRAIEVLASIIVLPARLLSAQLADFDAGGQRWQPLLLGIAVSGALGAVAYLIDLPGAFSAAIGCALCFAAVAVYAAWLGRTAVLGRIALAGGCAATLMWVAIIASPVRFDFYRFLGGDLSRRGQIAAALEAYEHAQRYAPQGMSRRRKIEQLRRELHADKR